MKIMQATWKSIEYTKNNFWEKSEKFTVYCLVCAVHKLYIYTKFKFSKKKKKEFYKQCFSIVLPCKIDSDSAQTLLNSPDHGGLWRFYDYVQNIFIVRKVFIRPLQTFKQLLIQQNWQWNPCFISNIDALCYNNQPKFIIDVWQRRRYNFLIFLQFRFTWTNFSFYISMI